MSESLGIFMFAPDVYSTRFIRLDRMLFLFSDLPNLEQGYSDKFLGLLYWKNGDFLS